MEDYVMKDSYTSEISTVQFFPSKYFNKYIKKFTSKNNLFSKNTSKTNTKIRPLIFITKIEYLEDFYNQVMTSLNTKFVLMTHYGSMEASFHGYKNFNHEKILNHPLLIKWYGINMSIISDKTSPIPLGLESKRDTNIDVIKRFSNNLKKKLLYLNFSLHTYPDRPKVMDILLQNGFVKNEKLDWEKYMEDLSTHKFCISPRGSGFDCYRTWECLYLGVIPIIEKSIPMNYFQDLPILFVDNYDIISVEYLNEKYKEFQNKSFNMDKLSINYWRKKIRGHFEK